MTTTLLMLLSAALIVTGVALIVRDVQRSARQAFLVPGERRSPTGADTEVEVTVARHEPELVASGPAGMPSQPEFTLAPEEAAEWAALQPAIGAAVDQVNAVLAAAGVAIGAAGEPSRSMGRGYGCYRRILIAGESVAWLRLELGAGGQLQASVKAHKEDLAAINASSGTAARGLNAARASDLLSECLKPAASFAMQTANGGSTEQWASETAWKAVEPVVLAALQAANGALAQAGTRFVPATLPGWADDVKRHRMAVMVEVAHTDVARMHIERTGEEIEVSVGVPDARLAALGRRERIAVEGLTTHALAELIASSAWPAIAHFRDAQHLA